MIKHDLLPESILFPESFNREYSNIPRKNQRRIIGLALVGMKRERDRLYEELNSGKALAENLPKAEQDRHYQSFMPPMDEQGNYPDVNRLMTFSNDFLCSFTGLKERSLYEAFKKGCDGVVGKRMSYEDKNENSYHSFSPIYSARYAAAKGCSISVAEEAVHYFMNHAKGFTEVDIKLWSELDNTHSMRLLQLVSGFKTGFFGKWTIDNFRIRMGLSQKYWETADEIMDADPSVYDVENAQIGSPRYFVNKKPDMSYPLIKDFRLRVIEPSFRSLIEKSEGVWSATDPDGKGFELVKTGKKYTHIKICLKYDSDATGVIENKSESQECDKTQDYVQTLIASIAKEAITAGSGEMTQEEIKKAIALALFKEPIALALFKEPIASALFKETIASALFKKTKKNSVKKYKDHKAKESKPKKQAKEICEREELEVSTFTYSKLETYFLFHGTESMTKEEAMKHATSREEMTLHISEVYVTRKPVGERDWEFLYEFCGEQRVINKEKQK